LVRKIPATKPIAGARGTAAPEVWKRKRSMARAAAGPEIERLIQLLARLPGLGPRSARRAALHLVKKKEQLLDPLAAALAETRDTILTCEVCGNIDTQSPCTLCQDKTRDPSLICVVEEVGDLWALERAAVVNGRYHVLGGTLSPLDGVGPDDLNIPKLIERARAGEVTEVLLALNATVEGQSTAHYLTDQLAGCHVSVSRLAQGVPIGGELDYLDEGTLAAAVKARKAMGG
jgi:recombination protein RecR